MKTEQIEMLQSTDEKSALTRRKFLDRIFLTVAGSAVVMISGTNRAAAKVSKMSAKYRSTPRMGKSCKGCARYQGNGKCSTVSGTVSPNGYCKFYSRKKSSSAY